MSASCVDAPCIRTVQTTLHPRPPVPSNYAAAEACAHEDKECTSRCLYGSSRLSALLPQNMEMGPGKKNPTHLELVQDLEMHRIQVSQRHVLQRVFERIERCRYRQLPAITREYRAVYLFEEHGGRSLWGKTPRYFVYGKCGRQCQLQHLVQQHRGTCEVSVVARRGHYSTVVHDLPDRGVVSTGAAMGGKREVSRAGWSTHQYQGRVLEG